MDDGSRLRIGLTPSGRIQFAGLNNAATVVNADISGLCSFNKNTVIHVIDSVFIPSSWVKKVRPGRALGPSSA